MLIIRFTHLELIAVMPMLYLTCKTCKTRFRSGISADKASLKTLILVNNLHSCPNGHSNAYNKQDYSFDT